uniref:Phorbol-ester/DAG-type domain-containing protein n=1 Tax=Steinernema glaseri TaxID=37863 RepID=A0A1I7ZDS5_9BILA
MISSTRLPIGLIHQMISVPTIIKGLKKEDKRTTKKCLSTQGYSQNMIQTMKRHFFMVRLQCKMCPSMDAFEHNDARTVCSHGQFAPG